MLVTFYPRDIGMWRKTFNFDDRTIEYPCKQFIDRTELIEFLKQHGITIDGEPYPLQFNAGCPVRDGRNLTHTVIQWTTIGWISEIESE